LGHPAEACGFGAFICDLENANIYFEDGKDFGRIIEITKAIGLIKHHH